MHLVIRAVSLAGQPLTQAATGYFDERGGTIGRSDTNTLALPDPERHISRLQAEVVRSDAGYSIRNVGSANSIMVNDRSIGPGEASALAEGDELQIGTYVLHVNFTHDNETVRTITEGRAAMDARTVIVGSGKEPKTDPSQMRPPAAAPRAQPPMSDPLAGFGPGAGLPSPAAGAPAASSADPFADLLGGFAPPPVAPLGSPLGAPGPAAPKPAFAGPAASSAVDPFADLVPSGSGSNPFGDLLGSPSPAPAARPPAAVPARPPAAPPVAAPRAPAPSAVVPPAFAPAPARPPAGPAADPFAGLTSAPPPAVTPLPPPPAQPAQLPKDFDPFADLVPRGPTSTPKPGAASAGAWDLPSAPAPVPSPPAAALPGDLDLLGGLGGSSGGSGRAGSGSSIDQMFGLASGPGSHPSADPLRDFLKTPVDESAPPPAGAPSSVDPLDLFGMSASGPTPSPPPPPALSAQDHLPELNAGFAAPRISSPGVSRPDLPAPVPAGPAAAAVPAGPASAAAGFAAARAPAGYGAGPMATQPAMHPGMPQARPAPPPQPASASAMAGAGADALWAAFCEGAGVSFQPPQGLNPELMRMMGSLLRHMVGGTLKLVAARAATKHELRAEVTTIRARNNNPLKFTPTDDIQSATEQLLQPPLRGFMAGPEAIDDVMDDLLGHAIGTMAGTRAALDGVLARFRPEQLEAKLSGRGMLDALLPMNRRAKLWELYLQHYEGVRTEAQEDFHTLFGKAFLQAYEDQLDRLDNARRQEQKG